MWRLAGIALLGALWVAPQMDEIGMVLMLVLAILGLARWRFSFPVWTTILDQAACVLAATLRPEAGFALALPAFETFLTFRPLYLIPSLAAATILGFWSGPFAATLAAAAFSGLTIHLWNEQVVWALRESDRDRKERYELEQLKAELLTANVRIARIAGAAERARIARDLHDHAGHEITAAQLALEAFARLSRPSEADAAELLDQARQRVASGMELLRRTAHDMSPEIPVGIGTLEEICRGFRASAVSFASHGDTGTVPIYAWEVLESCLKEALTNAARHERPTRIEVSVDVGPHIVRLSVFHPTERTAPVGRGVGLRNLSQRARAVGGSLTTDSQEGFRLVCVLPTGERYS